MSADILRRNLGNFGVQIWHSLHSQQPRQSRNFWAAVSAVTFFPSGNLVIFFLSQLAITHSRPAISAIPAISAVPAFPAGNLVFFSISAGNHPFSAGHTGNPGNLGRQSRQSRPSLYYLHSRHSQQSLQSLQYRPAISVAISTVLARTFGNLGLKIRHSRQHRQSRHFWAAVSSPGNSVRQPRQFFQSQLAIILSCPAKSALPAISGQNRGDLGNFAKICILGNLSNLCSLRNVGRHSPSQSWQIRSAKSALSSLPATSAISAILGGRLCDHGNPVWQPRHFFLSQHAITHSRPAKSVIPAILGDSLGDLGNLENICILGNPSNLCSLCNVGRQSALQSQQS